MTIELSDCGKEVMVRDPNYVYTYKAKVQMVITSPKGRLVIFSSDNWRVQDIQCKAIRTFMEIHKYD